jgi:HK97 family phage major capsid protein
MENDHPAPTDEQWGQLLESLTERLEPTLAETARRAVRDLEDAAPPRAAVPGLGDGEAADRTVRFFKAVLGGDLLQAKDLSGSTPSAGGVLVPEGFRQEVIRRLPEAAELAPHVRTVPVTTDTGSMPSLTTDISVTWRSAGGSENTAFGATDPVLGSVSWALKRADAITKLSRELVADGGPSVVQFVTDLFREAIARERDRVIAVGDGAAEPQGIAGTTLGAVAIDAAIDFGGLVAIEQSLPRKYRRRARWLMSGTNLQRIYSLADTQGRPIFVRDMVGGVPEARLLGYPVSQQDDLPDDTVWFGDLGYYLWFDRNEMGIESTNAGGDAFANHQTWIKVWERVDGKLGLPEAFVKGTGITG